MTRVFLDDTQIRGDTAVLSDGDAHHLLNVLRMGPGDSLIVVDARGTQRDAQIETVDGPALTVRLGRPVIRPAEPTMQLTLYHGLPRAARYETALRMCTELGVAEFVPVQSSRSVVRLAERDAPRKLERWRRIVEEAAKQSGRAAVPTVEAPVNLDAALDLFRASRASGLMPSAGLAGSDAPPLGAEVSALAQSRPLQRLALFIGPESGFDLAEEAAARDSGIVLVSMGPRILRTETAAVVAAAVCLDRLGELGPRKA